MVLGRYAGWDADQRAKEESVEKQPVRAVPEGAEVGVLRKDNRPTGANLTDDDGSAAGDAMAGMRRHRPHDLG